MTSSREDWLIRAKELLAAEFFSKPPAVLPKEVAVSCGIPKGSSKAIGQCWDPHVGEDGTTHVFICPSLGNSLEVLGVLLHELIHACVGLAEGHGGQFARMARAVGLEGKLTATVVKEGTPLHRKLQELDAKLGPYPHKRLDKQGRRGKRQQRKRVKLVSVNDPDYSVTMELALLQEHGPPEDPWGSSMRKPNEIEE